MNQDDEVRLEAAKLVKEWTLALVVLQSAAIGVAGSIIGQRPPAGWHLLLAVATFAAMLAAIYVGAVCVAGTLPAIVQKLPSSPGMDIYKMQGGLGGPDRWTLGKFCMCQSVLFMLSLVLLTAFILTGGPGK